MYYAFIENVNIENRMISFEIRRKKEGVKKIVEMRAKKFVANTDYHYSCNDCFFMTTVFFYPPIFDCKIRLLFVLDCGRGTLYHH